MHFFVAEFCFAQNLRLELELHEFLDAFSLQQDFRALLVNGHAQFVFLREENRVRLRRKLKTKLIEQRAQFRRLFV